MYMSPQNCTLTISPRSPVASRSLRARVRWLSVRIADLMLLWMERADQRRQLARLDSHLLKDIGVTRPEAAREASKPFWRP